MSKARRYRGRGVEFWTALKGNAPKLHLLPWAFKVSAVRTDGVCPWTSSGPPRSLPLPALSAGDGLNSEHVSIFPSPRCFRMQGVTSSRAFLQVRLNHSFQRTGKKDFSPFLLVVASVLVCLFLQLSHHLSLKHFQLHLLSLGSRTASSRTILVLPAVS